jgi:hypothetical protein
VRPFHEFLGILVIIVCGAVLLVSGYCAIVFFRYPQASVPLVLTAVVCAAIIFGILKAMRRGPR